MHGHPLPLVDGLRLANTVSVDCPYFADRKARYVVAQLCPPMPGGRGLYGGGMGRGLPAAPPQLPQPPAGGAGGGTQPLVAHTRMIQAGFRPKGQQYYRTACEGCRACRVVRLDVANLRPSRSQRRALAQLRRHTRPHPVLAADLRLAYFFQRGYLRARHREDEFPTWELFRRQTQSMHGTMHRSRRGLILGISWVQELQDGLDAVATAYSTAPGELRLGLGTGMIMQMAEQVLRAGKRYLYLGYWVRRHPAVHYKANFQPLEELCPDGVWRRMEPDGGSPGDGAPVQGQGRAARGGGGSSDGMRRRGRGKRAARGSRPSS